MSDVLQISLAAARVNANLTQEEAAKRMKIGKRRNSYAIFCEY